MKTDIFETLKFTQEWRDLGVVSDSILKTLEKRWLVGEDANPEHYRWSAFADFMANHPYLESEALRRLYRLGETDGDFSMGGAMMVAVLNRKECPKDLLHLASNSTEKFLRTVADRKLKTGN